KLLNPFRVFRPMELCSQCCLYCTTPLVAQDDQQRRAQVLIGILNTAGNTWRDEIAGESDDKKSSKALVEHQLRRDAGITAAKDHREGPLMVSQADKKLL